jgi:hypothetical protein
MALLEKRLGAFDLAARGPSPDCLAPYSRARESDHHRKDCSSKAASIPSFSHRAPRAQTSAATIIRSSARRLARLYGDHQHWRGITGLATSDSSNGVGTLSSSLRRSAFVPRVPGPLANPFAPTAFFESCCFVLPAYNYHRTRVAELRTEEWTLGPATKVRFAPPSPASLVTHEQGLNGCLLSQVAIAAFRAVGARTSTHSVGGVISSRFVGLTRSKR